MDACMRAAQHAQGSPYLLQLVGHNVVLMSDDNGRISDEAFDRALTMAAQTFERDVCETTLASLSEKDVEFLRAMAVDEASSRVSEVAGRMGVTVDYAQKYRKRLIGGGVIESEGRGYVGFAVPYLRDYLCRVE